MSYIRDAVQLGKVKAAFNVGHFNLEELGMKYAADWIPEVIGNAVPEILSKMLWITQSQVEIFISHGNAQR